ncbi:MAG: histidinol-phosphatase HisJ family protein [Bacillota bacterium]|nr:histidinol-phosphatase HisJ family protein [Bacillota bacterium]
MSSAGVRSVARFDYHLHPDFSIDASGTVREFCEAALARGLVDICFTTHCDTNSAHAAEDAWVSVGGKVRPLSEPWLPDYLAEIEAARRTFAARGLRVRAGLEVDFFPGAARALDALLAGVPLDFVLGSVHRVEGYALSDRAGVRAWLERFGPRDALVRYYDLVGEAAGSSLFDCIGHLDIYRRSAGLAGEEQLALPGVMDAVTRALAALVQSGTGLEINTRGTYRAGAAHVSPGPVLLRLAAAAGVPLLTLGSDAHQPRDVGLGLDLGIAAACAAGFRVQHTFEGRRPQAQPLSAETAGDAVARSR